MLLSFGKYSSTKLPKPSSQNSMISKARALILVLIMLASVGLAIYQERGGRGGNGRDGTGTESSAGFAAYGGNGGQIAPAFAAYIAGYSGGIRSVTTSIEIQFAEPTMGDSALVAAEAVGDFVTISPAVEGSWKWKSLSSLVFTPEEVLEYETSYNVELQLSKLFEIENEHLKQFEFSFRTKPQSIKIGQTTWGRGKEDGQAMLMGEIRLGDYAPGAAVEKGFAAKAGNNALKVGSWVHSDDGRNHKFALLGVPKDESVLTLAMEGDAVGTDDDAQRKWKLPAAKGLKVWNVEETTGPERALLIRFTDELAADQQLGGLLSIDKMAVDGISLSGSTIKVPLAASMYGKKALSLYPGIAAVGGNKLLKGQVIALDLQAIMPSVRRVSDAYMRPLGAKAIPFTFEAAAVRRVHVQIAKVEPKNMPAFLANNALEYHSYYGEFAKAVTVDLQAVATEDLHGWNKFTINLAKYVGGEQGALYFAQVSFDKEGVLWNCDGEKDGLAVIDPFRLEDGEDEPSGNPDYYEYEEGADNLNPCTEAYYRNGYASNSSRQTQIGQYVINSNLALVAKKEQGGMAFAVSNLGTTDGEGGVQIALYNRYMRQIGQATTGQDGLGVWKGKGEPNVAIASKDGQYAFVRLDNSNALSTTGFKVGGEMMQRGKKGFIYTERGVYRPGDTVHIGFIASKNEAEKAAAIPSPVVMRWYSEQGVELLRKVKAEAKHGHFRFDVPTSADMPTGNYRIDIFASGATFTKYVGIETVKPNRLAVLLKPALRQVEANKPFLGSLQGRWLFGSPAAGYRATISAKKMGTNWVPKGFEEYDFKEEVKPSNAEGDEFEEPVQDIYDGVLNAEGFAEIRTELPKFRSTLPVQVGLTSTVFEPGGEFSTDFTGITMHPYPAYMGVKIAEVSAADNLPMGKPVKFDIIQLDPIRNKTVAAKQVEVRLIKLEWRWWWEDDEYSSVYLDGNYSNVVMSQKLAVPAAGIQSSFTVEEGNWGRYLLQVINPETGHSTSKTLYFGWPESVSLAESRLLNKLKLATDKKEYMSGETVNITVPNGQKGTTALVSLEIGDKVVKQFYTKLDNESRQISFKVEENYTPNVYAFITLVRPYAEASKLKPLRQFGVVNVNVRPSARQIQPVLTLKENAQPGQILNLKVAEKGGKSMTYALAIVDEGLLNITRFETPDPFATFFAKTAHQVRTFDNYQEVITPEYLENAKLLAFGGDGAMSMKAMADSEEQKNSARFRSFSKFLGPFTLKDGENASHAVVLPDNPGKVRVMLIANTDNSYGSAEKFVSIKSDLNILGSAPRTLSVGDVFTLPIQVVANKPNVKDVTVTLKAGEGVKVIGPTTQKAVVSVGKDAIVNFTVQAGSAVALANIVATATSGAAAARWSVKLPVRIPNLPTSSTSQLVLEPKESKTMSIVPFGLAGSNSYSYKVDSKPNLDFERRLDYLISYPYGCLEQTVSAALGQLYLPRLTELSAKQQAEVQSNVNAAIGKLTSFRVQGGGFSYWPSEPVMSPFATMYATFFLKEANRMGYTTPEVGQARIENLFDNSGAEMRVETQTMLAMANLFNSNYQIADLANRTIQNGKVAPQAAWLFAAGFAAKGNAAAEAEAMKQTSMVPMQVPRYFYSYGSGYRDKALILYAMSLLGKQTEAAPLAKELGDLLGSEMVYLSTQDIGWAMAAFAKYYEGAAVDGSLEMAAKVEGQNYAHKAKGKAITQVFGGKQVGAFGITFSNSAISKVFITIKQKGTPLADVKARANTTLDMTIAYRDLKGKAIDPLKLKAGSSFTAMVTVTNKSEAALSDLALTERLPSGWEIRNEAGSKTPAGASRIDVRDDKKYTFFNLEGRRSITFKTTLTATYKGKYTLPAVMCEAMYAPAIAVMAAGGQAVVY